MHPEVELNLALILFLPWFLILGSLFWIYPRAPKSTGRRLFDAATLLGSLLAALGGMYWGMWHADRGFGHMWQQVVATSVSYGLYLAVMTAALIARHYWIVKPAKGKSA